MAAFNFQFDLQRKQLH